MSQVCAARGGARRLGVLAVVAVHAALALHVGGARADGPGVGSPWVAGVGDSYISGEAATAPSRRRSTWAAASTARTSRAGGPRPPRATGRTPGLDFYVNDTKQGQALALQGLAASHNVKMIALSIGGNNFNFASIVQGCFQDWLLSPSWWKDSCNDDSSLKANFTAANVAAQTAAIKGAILNIRQAMANAGYADASYTILVQDYESPLPRGPGFRYGESGYTRQSTGGCGFWNNDANWANGSALPSINVAVRNAAAQTGLANVKVLELQAAFNGHRLCENTVGLLEEKGLTSWTQAGAVDKSEWINQIRTVSTVFGPYQVQESLHPNYWGQLALRSCARQAYNGGTPRGGTCTIAGPGLTSRGEPNMTLG